MESCLESFLIFMQKSYRVSEYHGSLRYAQTQTVRVQIKKKKNQDKGVRTKLIHSWRLQV